MGKHATGAAAGRCLGTLIVVGGGRWARVLVETLDRLVPSQVAILLCSRHGREASAAWSKQRGLAGRVRLLDEFPAECDPRSTAAIVANAARDHRAATERALRTGIPVLVEKPVALSQADAQALVRLAQQQDMPLAAAQVFLFASYFENFARCVRLSGPVESVQVTWTDPVAEVRYGEQKRYDAGVPVFCDWLPHLVPLLGVVCPGEIGHCEVVDVRRGGAAVTLVLKGPHVVCTAQLERNAERRRREVVVRTDAETHTLDFATEPGMIISGGRTVSGDSGWERAPRPLARLLEAFLVLASGGPPDSRLDMEYSLRSCRLVDVAMPAYRAAVLRWLAPRIANPALEEADVRYALCEMLQTEGRLETAELERGIRALKAEFASANGARLIEELTRSDEPAQVLETIARTLLTK